MSEGEGLGEFNIWDILRDETKAAGSESMFTVIKQEIEGSDVTDEYPSLDDWLHSLARQLMLSMVLDCEFDEVHGRILELEELWAKVRRQRYLEADADEG